VRRVEVLRRSGCSGIATHGKDAHQQAQLEPKESPLLQPRPRPGNPDASLFALGAPASAAGAPRGGKRPGSSSGSVRRREPATRAGEPGHTLSSNSDCRDRSVGRCVPASRSARSYRADSSLRSPPPCPRAIDDWTTPPIAGIKAERRAPLRAEHPEGPGFRQELIRAFAFYGRAAIRIAKPAPPSKSRRTSTPTSSETR
jgi:hypothetical protein